MLELDTAGSEIFLKGLRTDVVLQTNAWGLPRKVPVLLNVRLFRKFDEAGKNDSIDGTLSYSTICQQVLDTCSTVSQGVGRENSALESSITTLHGFIHAGSLQWDWGSGDLIVETTFPKGILRADGGCTLLTRSTHLAPKKRVFRECQWSVSKLTVACIIGVNPHEREKKQNVHINLQYSDREWTAEDLGPRPGLMPHTLADIVVETVEGSAFKTLEALAYRVFNQLKNEELRDCTISIEKPSAIDIVDGSGVTVRFKQPSEKN